MSIKVEIEGAIQKPRTRKFTRPTTPELEQLYFKVAVNLSKRETAIFMHCLGRSADGGDGVATLLNTPEPVA